jgi:hypothetical protein
LVIKARFEYPFLDIKSAASRNSPYSSSSKSDKSVIARSQAAEVVAAGKNAGPSERHQGDRFFAAVLLTFIGPISQRRLRVNGTFWLMRKVFLRPALL